MAEVLSREWSTVLSVTALQDWFRETALARCGQAAHPVDRQPLQKVVFFAPEEAPRGGRVALSVGARLPGRAGIWRYGRPATVHMHVRNVGDRRAVELRTPIASSLDRMVAALRGSRSRAQALGRSRRYCRRLLDYFEERLAATEAELVPLAAGPPAENPSTTSP